MGLITALSAAGLAAGLAVTGATAAAASAPASSAPAASAAADITLPSGSILAQKVTRYCARVPDLQARAVKAQARLSGSAGTKGSIAWLKAREAAQQKKGHPAVVNRIDKIVTRRTARLAKLPTVESNLAKAKTQCAGLNLGSGSSTPSGTPSVLPSATSTS
jgi:hypothetical protein